MILSDVTAIIDSYTVDDYTANTYKNNFELSSSPISCTFLIIDDEVYAEVKQPSEAEMLARCNACFTYNEQTTTSEDFEDIEVIFDEDEELAEQSVDSAGEVEQGVLNISTSEQNPELSTESVVQSDVLASIFGTSSSTADFQATSNLFNQTVTVTPTETSDYDYTDDDEIIEPPLFDFENLEELNSSDDIDDFDYADEDSEEDSSEDSDEEADEDDDFDYADEDSEEDSEEDDEEDDDFDYADEDSEEDEEDETDEETDEEDDDFDYADEDSEEDEEYGTNEESETVKTTNEIDDYIEEYDYTDDEDEEDDEEDEYAEEDEEYDEDEDEEYDEEDEEYDEDEDEEYDEDNEYDEGEDEDEDEDIDESEPDLDNAMDFASPTTFDFGFDIEPTNAELVVTEPATPVHSEALNDMLNQGLSKPLIAITGVHLGDIKSEPEVTENKTDVPVKAEPNESIESEEQSQVTMPKSSEVISELPKQKQASKPAPAHTSKPLTKPTTKPAPVKTNPVVQKPTTEVQKPKEVKKPVSQAVKPKHIEGIVKFGVKRIITYKQLNTRVFSDLILIITCESAQQAQLWAKSTFQVGKAYAVKELDTKGYSYAFYPKNTDLSLLHITDCCILYVVADCSPAPKSVTNEDKVIFNKTMPLHEFLQLNPTVRSVDELRKYYSMEVINRGQQYGVFVIRKGRINF